MKPGEKGDEGISKRPRTNLVVSFTQHFTMTAKPITCIGHRQTQTNKIASPEHKTTTLSPLQRGFFMGGRCIRQ
jgi:hypothetical protein